MPEQDAVLAITSGVGDMQAVLNAAWDHLLPAMQQETLSAGVANLRSQAETGETPGPPAGGQAASPTAARVSGRACRFEANEDKLQSGTLNFKGNRCTMTLRDEGGERRFECGSGAWVKASGSDTDGTNTFSGQPGGKVAASGAWTDADTFEARLCFYETPFIQTVTWNFDGDKVTVSRKTNVGFGPTERPTLTGRLA